MHRSPLDAEDLRVRVQKTLDEFLAAQVPQLDLISDDLGPMIDSIGGLLSGGKRLRAAFCFWGWRGAGCADGEQLEQDDQDQVASLHGDVGSASRRGPAEVSLQALAAGDSRRCTADSRGCTVGTAG